MDLKSPLWRQTILGKDILIWYTHNNTSDIGIECSWFGRVSGEYILEHISNDYNREEFVRVIMCEFAERTYI